MVSQDLLALRGSRVNPGQTAEACTADHRPIGGLPHPGLDIDHGSASAGLSIVARPHSRYAGSMTVPQPPIGPLPASTFRPDQIDSSYPEGIERHFWMRVRNRMILNEVQAADANSPAPRRWLEIGCGQGVVLRALRAGGIACDGVEPSPELPPADVAPHIRTGLDCFQIPAAERDAYAGLLLLDVLEHIEDPVGFLKDVRQAYPHARTLVATVPARAELWSNYDTHYGHFRRYDRASLLADLGAGGFRMARARYAFRALYPVMRGFALMRRPRPIETRAPARPALHAVAAMVVATLDRLTPAAVPGTSLIVRAEASP